MQIVVLAGLAITLMMLEDGAPVETIGPGWWTAVAVPAYLAVAWAVGRAGAVVGLRRLRDRADGPKRPSLAQRLLGLLTSVWLVGGSAGVVVCGYGHWIMEDLELGCVPLLGRLLGVAPFVAALLAAWVASYPLYRAARRRSEGNVAWDLGEYLGYNVRHHLLFILAPVSLVLLGTDALVLYVAPLLPESPAGEFALAAGMLATVGGVFLFAPAVIVNVWKTARLPDGPLRRELEDVGRRFRLRWRDILVWRSGGAIANAGVMGLIGRIRYVLLSDGLLERMNDVEIRAIFAHEAAHIRAHHIFYSAVFVISSVTLSTIAGLAVATAMGLPAWAEGGVALSLVILTIGVGFGWISRRFERQCDVAAAWEMGRLLTGEQGDGPRLHPEGVAAFAGALQRVADLNGIPAGQWNWRHGSILCRVGHVMWLGSTGRGRDRIDRLVRWIKVGIWSMLALTVAASLARPA
mgnify:CR=1 FL=1